MGVASRDFGKGLAYAEEWGIPHVFANYNEMLQSDQVDAVYISLPNHLHAQWAIRALEAGKHVLCEKPFAITVEQVDQMIAASQRTGRKLMEAFMYRHHPQTKLVGEWVSSGRLGDIRLVRAHFSFFMQNRLGNVRLEPDYGGGALWDVGIYPVSFAQYIFGRLPESVYGQQSIGDTGVDETFSGQLNYAQGQAAQICGSFEIQADTLLDIYGTQGRLTLNRPFNNINEKGHQVLFTSVDGYVEKLRTKAIDPYQAEVDDFNQSILEDRPPLISLTESRMHIQTAVALYESARAGRSVAIEITE